MRLALIAALWCSAAVADDFHVTVGRMEIQGLDGGGTTLEVGRSLADRLVTVGLIGNQDYGTISYQSVRSGWSAYAAINFVRTDKWLAGIGAAYVDYETTDVHGLRGLFGAPPLMGETDRFAPALTLSRSFGPAVLAFRHFRLSTSGGWIDTDSVNMLSIGAGF